MKRQPERTCIGCRSVFEKNNVVRIIAGPDGVVIDYREKLPGRAAYICPKRECINKAFSKGNLSKALHCKIRMPSLEEFISSLATAIQGRIKSLVSMSIRAGKLAAGYSAVKDALEKGRIELIVYAQDISEGTLGKVAHAGPASMRTATIFTRDELGGLLNRELVGVLGIEDKRLADAIWKEAERLKDLINVSE
jgi:predicted RNA-binding protein YlxR (DUF448 family)